MPCLCSSPERKSTSKAPKRVLRVRVAGSITGFRKCRHCITNSLAPKGYLSGSVVFSQQNSWIQRVARLEEKQAQNIRPPLCRKPLRSNVAALERAESKTTEGATYVQD